MKNRKRPTNWEFLILVCKTAHIIPPKFHPKCALEQHTDPKLCWLKEVHSRLSPTCSVNLVTLARGASDAFVIELWMLLVSGRTGFSVPASGCLRQHERLLHVSLPGRPGRRRQWNLHQL